MHDADRYETISMHIGKKTLLKKNMYVYAITNHQNTFIFFSIILRVLDIHHGRMRQDLLQRSSVFFLFKTII